MAFSGLPNSNTRQTSMYTQRDSGIARWIHVADGKDLLELPHSLAVLKHLLVHQRVLGVGPLPQVVVLHQGADRFVRKLDRHGNTKGTINHNQIQFKL